MNTLPIRGPDPGTPQSTGQGHCAAHIHVPEPSRTLCKQDPTGYKQPGMYTPPLPKQLARRGPAVYSGPPPSPKGSSPQSGIPRQGIFIWQVQQASKLLMYKVPLVLVVAQAQLKIKQRIQPSCPRCQQTLLLVLLLLLLLLLLFNSIQF